MTRRDRELERIAWRLFELLRTSSSNKPAVQLPRSAWLECEKLSRRIGKANARGWNNAARRLHRQLLDAQKTLLDRLTVAQRELSLSMDPPPRITFGDLYRDLVALRTEFANVQYDHRHDELSVTTGEIILDDLNFGSFAIVLECRQLGNALPYRVEALDANPASGSFQTTHPHVQSDTLCEGEGRVPIERALYQGRLLDFFVIVRQILDTYNPDSAYVSLAEWHGMPCQDCGCSMGEEDRESCYGCETDLCSECSYVCQRCSERFCNGCTEACEVCHEYYCRTCLQRCSECELLYCEDCQTHDQCPNCAESQATEEEKCNSADFASVHVPCVGQTVVPS